MEGVCLSWSQQILLVVLPHTPAAVVLLLLLCDEATPTNPLPLTSSPSLPSRIALVRSHSLCC